MAILDYYESHHDEAPDRKIFFEEVHDNCNWISFAHHHRAIEFCFVRSGNVKCCIDGKLIEISAGEIVYIDSFNVHYFYIGENCDRIAIVIGADFLKDFFTVYNKKDKRARFLCKLYDKEKNAELFAYVGAWLKQYDGLNELQNLGKLNYFLGLVAAKYGVEYEDRKDDNLAAKDWRPDPVYFTIPLPKNSTSSTVVKLAIFWSHTAGDGFVIGDKIRPKNFAILSGVSLRRTVGWYADNIVSI